jgi:EF hand domain-containing protein
MPSRVSLFVTLIPVLAFCAGAGVVQPQETAVQPERGSSPMVERLMALDANSDGKLTQEELGEGRGTRLFEFADTNEDGMLERGEIEKFFASRRGSGQPRRVEAPEPKEVSGEEVFHESMEQSGRALRKLKRIKISDESREADLALIQKIQEGLLGAKAAYMDAPVSENAEKEFGQDHSAMRTTLRMNIARALKGTLEIELAILEGDSDAAIREIKKLQNMRDKAHDLFEPEEEDDD